MNAKRIRVLHVDDNDDARALLSLFLRRERDLEEVGARDRADDLERDVLECAPDVLVIDLVMHGRDPVEAIRGVRAAFPALRIVVLSGSSDPALLERARFAGASQVALKSIDLYETLDAIRGRERRPQRIDREA